MDAFKVINSRPGIKIIKFIKSMHLISAIIGGTLGYLFYYSTSCCSDEMIISLNPYFTVIYGFVTGALLSIKR
jgi:hypothetical protein